MQNHHVCCLALGGIHYLPDGAINSANLVPLTKEQHKLIHSTLDIPYDFIREFRKRNAWKLRADEAYQNDLKGLQWEYFRKMRALPFDLQMMHINSFKGQLDTFKVHYKYPFDIPDYHLEPTYVHFEYLFEQYHNIFFHAIKKQ